MTQGTEDIQPAPIAYPQPAAYQPPTAYQQQPQAPQSQAPATQQFVRFHLQGSALTSSMITPTVAINGYQVPAHYGENMLAVHPGRNEISAKAQWMREYGQASYTVDVPPGGIVDAWYAAPMTQFQRGAMGPVKQKRPGLLILVIVLVVVIALVIGLPIASVLAS